MAARLLFLLIFSCSKEFDETSPLGLKYDMENTEEVNNDFDLIDNPFPDGDNNKRDPRFSDCRCEMSVVDVENTPQGNGATWSLIDVRNQTQSDLEFNGYQLEQSDGTFKTRYTSPGVSGNDLPEGLALPTPFFPLNQPHYQNHMFYVVTGFPGTNSSLINDDFTIHTQVKCYSINGNTGEELLTTTTNHAFRWEDRVEVMGSPGLWFASFFKEFACTYLTVNPK